MESNHTNKSFFEKYQTFFALIIMGIFIGGGLVIGKMIPQKTTGGASEGPVTESEVKEDMTKVAKSLGINKSKFATCLDSGEKKQVIADAVTVAQKSGVSGTPTFFVLKRTLNAKDEVTSTKQFMILGARDEATFLKAITDGKSPADQPAQPAGEKIVLSDTDHWMGPKNAEVVIVEYADIDCYYCKQVKPTIDKILKDHPEYAFVFRHAPIISLHPWAEYKAEAAECVATLGGEKKFFEFLDATIK